MLKIPKKISARGIIELALDEYDLLYVNKHFTPRDIYTVKKTKEAMLDLIGALFTTWNSYMWFTQEFVIERRVIEFYINIVYTDRPLDEGSIIRERIASFKCSTGTVNA